jgi:hypothetical protein
MIDEADFEAAVGASDPNMAFARLETQFRKALNANAAQYFHLDFLDFFEVPDPDGDKISDTFRRFTTLVDAFKVRAQLEYVRSPMEFSVGLSNADKEKIRFYVEQMKLVIDAASLAEQKRDALYDKLNKFLAEVDRNRAPWTRFGDIIIYLASVGGDAAEKLEPARKWIDSIAKLLGHNKEIENSQPKLPKLEKKQIQDQRWQFAGGKKRDDLDSEIPF